MKLSTYANQLSLEQRLDLLNHIPCLTLAERRDSELIKYHLETLDKWSESGGNPILHDIYTDEFSKELGITQHVMHTHALNEVTVWKEYCYIKENILQLEKARHSLSDILMEVLNEPSTRIEDIRSIHRSLNEFSIHANQYDDYFIEAMGTVFSLLYPYKLHAFGMTEFLYNNAILVQDPMMYQSSFNYLEMLIRIFMDTLQRMRGCSLSETKHKLEVLTVCVYLYTTTIFKGPEIEKEAMQLFIRYIDRMLQAGLGEHVITRVNEMIRANLDWMDVISIIKEDDIVASYLKKFDYKRKIVAKTIPVSYLQSIWTKNAEHVMIYSWLVIGKGIFSSLSKSVQTMRDDEKESSMLYNICARFDTLGETEIKKLVGVENRELFFSIDENTIGYILTHISKDMLWAVEYPLVDFAKQSRYVIHLPDSKRCFLLFQLSFSKFTYGISVIPKTADGSYQLLQIDTDGDAVSYKLLMGNEVD